MWLFFTYLSNSTTWTNFLKILHSNRSRGPNHLQLIFGDRLWKADSVEVEFLNPCH